MRIGILGTGTVGRTLAARLDELGHSVVVGTRDPDATLARSETDAMGTPPFASWHAEHPGVALATFAGAADAADLVVNANLGSSSIDILTAAGADALQGRVLLDITNPLDFSRGMPPSLFVKDTDSLGEQIQRAFPGVRVVKALNTMGAPLMVDPGALSGDPMTTFICGNDAAAKQIVGELLAQLGHRDVLDLGELSAARGTEMLMPLWLTIWGRLGTPMFGWRIVR